MRIAIFTETFLPGVNGVVTRLLRTLGHLGAEGDRVLVVAPRGGPDICEGAEVLGVPAMPLPLYPEISIAMPRPQIGRRLQRFRPDVIHAVNPAVLGLAASHYARTMRRPLVASFHTNLPRYLRHYGLGLLEPVAWDLLRSIHNHADVNLCISDPVARDLVQRGFERVRVAWRGGVDVEAFHPRRADPGMRARLTGGHPGAPLLLYAGRLGAEKNLELLRPTLAGIPGARLALVGDGPHRLELEQQFNGLPVHFTGYLRGEELAKAYASADAFVFPSATDTLGLVVLEAMASGLPVVGARAGGIPDLVEHGVSGLLFEPDDAAGAARLVARALTPSAEREMIRLNGRRVAEGWGWRAAARDLRRVYSSVLAPGHPESSAAA